MRNFYNYTVEELKKYLIDLGYKAFSAEQLYKWVYEQRISDYDKMTNISKALRSELNDKLEISDLEIHSVNESSDGTIKYLLRLEDGSLIETVLMTYDYGKSVCVTSQVGCNMGCSFCASGLLKKKNVQVVVSRVF